MAAIGKVLGTAKRDVLIVDPYADEKALTDFAPLAREGISVRMLPMRKITSLLCTPPESVGSNNTARLDRLRSVWHCHACCTTA